MTRPVSAEDNDPCPACLVGSSKVADSRPYGMNPAWRIRRRLCPACGHRWTTVEVPKELVEAIIGNGSGLKGVIDTLPAMREAITHLEREIRSRLGILPPRPESSVAEEWDP